MIEENLPKGWAEIILDDYVFIAGRIGWKGLKSSEYTDTGPFLLAVKDIDDNGQINYNGVRNHISEFRYDESPEIKLCKDDILITKDGTIGKIGYVNDLPSPTTVNSSILVVRPAELMFPKYLFHYFRSPLFQHIVKEKIKGISIPHLFQYDIKKFHLRIAPSNEQKRIVSKIESIFAQIDAAKERLETLASQTKLASNSLEMLRSSVLKQAFEGKLVPQDPNDEPAELLLKKINKDSKEELVFENDNLPKGWIETKLENCIEILDSKRIPINSSERKQRQGKIPYYGSTGQVGWINDYLFNEELVLLGEDAAPFLDNFKDKAYLISGNSWVNNHAHVLKGIADLLLNSFLCYFLNQFNYHDYVTGTTRLKLNQTRMKMIPILIPPINEQKCIVSKIESIFAEIDATNKYVSDALRTLDMLKQSVLKQAFEGKLVPQDPDDEPAEILLQKIHQKKQLIQKTKPKRGTKNVK